MGWYCHPDTVAMAGATGAADRSGRPSGSAAWLVAYRDAYEQQNKGGGYDESLAEYLAKLDAEIEARMRGGDA